MATAGPATTPPGPAPRWRGDDFPAWLSPMLVKELRQGIQSGMFAWTFVALHVSLLVLMLFWLGVVGANPAGDRSSGGFFRGLFWMLLGGALVAVIPFRGVNALKSEEAGNTFDLLRLTRLSATQIVTGKWLATVAQLLLLATAVLPYVVLQYYLGGYAVFTDLMSVAVLVVAGSVTTALAILLSAQPQWTRGLAVVGMVIGGYAALVVVFGGIRIGGSASDMGSLARLLVGAAAVVLTCLEFTAAKIAPVAENHALRKRGLALACAAMALAALAIDAFPATGVRLATGVDWMLPALLGLIAALVMMAELFTDPVERRSIHEPFARWGVVGRVLAGLLTPGWATAVPLAALLLLAFAFGVPALVSPADDYRGWAARAGLCGAALLFPVPFTRLLRKPGPRLLVAALVSLASCLPLAYQQSHGPFMRPTISAIVEALIAILPLPRLLSWPGRVNPAVAVPPMLLTGLVWLFLTPAWLAAQRRTQRLVASCRTSGAVPRRSVPADGAS
ncbi:MAG: hypothetical protein EBR86_08805 [Planctomycetia bacterium]|nr:hypothetical protein [Planctomycetia bacterium]